MQALSCHAYYSHRLLGKKEWQPVEVLPPSKAPRQTKAVQPLLAVATLNVWFDAKFADVRYPTALSLLASLQADVICLQEVNARFMAELWAHKEIQERFAYLGSGSGGRTIASATHYGCVMLFDRATVCVSRTAVRPFPGSRQGRHLLSACVTGLAGRRTEGIVEFEVGTAHLESPVPGSPSVQERISQLEQVHHMLSVGSGIGALFCGDTNISSDEARTFPPSVSWFTQSDLWLAAGRNDDEPTFGTTFAVKEPLKRIDRLVLVRAARPYTVVRSETFGTEQIRSSKYEGFDVWPSDHLGVVVAMRFEGEGY